MRISGANSLTGKDFCTRLPDIMKLLLVRAGQDTFGVAADTVIQILVPSIDAGLEFGDNGGHLVHRGRRFPFSDLRAAGTAGHAGSPVCVLLERGARRAAVGVDVAESIREVADGAVAPLPGFIFARPRRVQGVLEIEGNPVLLLDVGAIL